MCLMRPLLVAVGIAPTCKMQKPNLPLSVATLPVIGIASGLRIAHLAVLNIGASLDCSKQFIIIFVDQCGLDIAAAL